MFVNEYCSFSFFLSTNFKGQQEKDLFDPGWAKLALSRSGQHISQTLHWNRNTAPYIYVTDNILFNRSFFCISQTYESGVQNIVENINFSCASKSAKASFQITSEKFYNKKQKQNQRSERLKVITSTIPTNIQYKTNPTKTLLFMANYIAYITSH